MPRTTFLLTLAILALPAARPLAADVVNMSDGSMLVGKVEQMYDGTLVLVTEFAGTLELKMENIVSIETDEKVHINLDSGDRLVGSVDWSSDIGRAIVRTEIGDIPVPLNRLTAIWPPDGKSPEVIALEAQIEAVRTATAAQMPKWSLNLEVGILHREGNTEETEVRGRIEGIRKSPIDLFRVYVAGNYAETNKIRNTAEVIGGMYYEHLIFRELTNDRMFAYGRMEAEYDEFEQLDLRFTAALGGGFYFIKEDWTELKGRTGVGYQHESYFDGTTTDDGTLDVGLDYRVDIAPWLRFTSANTWFPTFRSIRDYRLISDNALLIPIGASEVFKLKLGALYEYKSLPQPGIRRLDQTYYAAIVLSLEQK